MIYNRWSFVHFVPCETITLSHPLCAQRVSKIQMFHVKQLYFVIFCPFLLKEMDGKKREQRNRSDNLGLTIAFGQKSEGHIGQIPSGPLLFASKLNFTVPMLAGDGRRWPRAYV